ncbi:MAG: hypothetical protein ACI8R4_004308 [Paracoccaceae bacterium]|jgi:hypothetical protein
MYVYCHLQSRVRWLRHVAALHPWPRCVCGNRDKDAQAHQAACPRHVRLQAHRILPHRRGWHVPHRQALHGSAAYLLANRFRASLCVVTVRLMTWPDLAVTVLGRCVNVLAAALLAVLALGLVRVFPAIVVFLLVVICSILGAQYMHIARAHINDILPKRALRFPSKATRTGIPCRSSSVKRWNVHRCRGVQINAAIRPRGGTSNFGHQAGL